MDPMRRVLTADAGLAAALVLVCLVTVPFIDDFRTVDEPVDALAVALIVVAGSAIAGRRRWPVPALAVTTVATSAYLVLSYPYGLILMAVAIAVYSVARRTPLLPALLWCAVALAVLLLHLFTNPAALDGPAGLLPGSAWVAIPFTIGVARRLVAEAGARERAESERRLVDGERLRLAQEVHDVVGHGLAAIQMQADIALHLKDSSPGQAHVALAAISRASSDALAELRATLAAISPDGSDPGETRAPAPGLARVDDLRRRVEDAGVAVDMTVRGRPRPLPAAVDLAAYRILQESLTNVVKHSPHPRAAVEIAYRPGEVALAVANQDLAGGAHTEGFGIAGMRRRAAHLGGDLTAGPAGPGEFAVRATIPTGE
jgi:signal transduction histidine kinase